MSQLSVIRARRREQTRDALINAAVRVFSKYGYERATIDLVAQAAGYSKGAFYVHFESKEAMLLEIVSAAVSQLDELGDADIEQTIAAFAALVRDHPYWPPLVSEFGAHAWRNPDIREGVERLWERCTATVEQALTNDSQHSNGHARADAEMLIALFRGETLNPGATAETIEEKLSHGLRLLRPEGGQRRRGRAA
ncbi:MAG: helix-turn-helix domain-containing protein [Dehalococcoidia bacterium]